MVQPIDRDSDWDFHFRSLSSNARDSTDPASDPSLLRSVKRLHQLCKAENSEELVARVYPPINKLFQRSVASLSQSQTSNGLLLLAILQFFLDFGEVVLHDADPSLRTFFRSCLSREFADPVVAEATLDFLNLNKAKLLSSFPSLLPQFFPLLLKLIAWNGERLEKSFLKVFPGIMSPGSFLPLFPSLVDLPVLVVAMEKVERSSGSLIGSSIASIQKSTAPEMLLALMDEAYTGSTIEDRGADSGSDDNSTIDVVDSLFLDLLKDENDGLAERHWTSPRIATALQAAINTAQSDRVWKRLLEFILAAFLRSPDFVALLKKPIIDRLGEAYDSTAKTELALQLCWAIGEYGGGGMSHKDAARELFESLELLLYENLSSSRLGLSQESTLTSDGAAFRKSSQARLLCFVVTAIAKLATYHRELLPRARVSLAKVARSRNSDMRVWRRARDYLGLMNEPAICLSVLGPSSKYHQNPGTVNWSEGGSKMISHIPFYILSEQEGPPFHDFSFSDILPRR
ncbi:AP-5 complex subunit zeta-1 isoform X2 [Tasmannia lanceolata]|uniref:AP-5 complex subunit zeta-1 isoform X2 n=1 Tax=Tasmannia lanceolata TaxID=3420 RepID=UPI004064ACF1